jgi:hypothetical protein
MRSVMGMVNSLTLPSTKLGRRRALLVAQLPTLSGLAMEGTSGHFPSSPPFVRSQLIRR